MPGSGIESATAHKNLSLMLPLNDECPSSLGCSGTRHLGNRNQIGLRRGGYANGARHIRTP